ncbi:LPXTG cell wall anchor domain-containing protein [Jannaschia donghaensis]|uniref:Uncharacterized protein n=1 Tax=Jannaschia donghaensis TaxID=420998 RepID=A0A0M6YKY7_9RHOB|nr:LPXTG cell wall anchor domain-containing protein [Jannaschia donghaensis]CTQ50564.1 hypothetical protein JDO7802_02589 [Jannaschia donghaensis]
MRRLHFYIMGLISLAFGVIGMAEYVMVSYGLQLGWLDGYPADQLEWLGSLPNWVHGVWGAQATLALVGALCLLAHLRPAVWMLFFSFLTLVVLIVWAAAVATPSILALTGDETTTWIIMGLTALLSLLIYLYARQEKRTGEVL